MVLSFEFAELVEEAVAEAAPPLAPLRCCLLVEREPRAGGVASTKLDRPPGDAAEPACGAEAVGGGVEVPELLPP